MPETMNNRDREAGQIPKDWMANAMHAAWISEAPRMRIEDWFITASNCSLEISAYDRTVWNATTGAWLTQSEIDRLCAIIDQGV